MIIDFLYEYEMGVSFERDTAVIFFDEKDILHIKFLMCFCRMSELRRKVRQGGDGCSFGFVITAYAKSGQQYQFKIDLKKDIEKTDAIVFSDGWRIKGEVIEKIEIAPEIFNLKNNI